MSPQVQPPQKINPSGFTKNSYANPALHTPARQDTKPSFQHGSFALVHQPLKNGEDPQSTHKLGDHWTLLVSE